MTKLSFTCLLFLLAIQVFGQAPKVSKKKEDTRNGKAIYYVLQSDQTTYHGRYTITGWSGNDKIVDGNYVMGKKEGLWTERYYGVGKRGPRSYGYYKEDIKTGKWIYFTISGDTAQVYDYTSNKLIFSNECNDLKSYKVKSSNGFEDLVLDCPPVYVSGRDIFNTELMQNLRSYPRELKESGAHQFSIDTEMLLTIDENGQVMEVEFSRKIGYGYEESITEWVNEKGNNWIPGEVNGHRVTTMLSFPIRYRAQF